MKQRTKSEQMPQSKLELLRLALKRFRNADTELRRAGSADDATRLNKAGTRYALAKFNLFELERLL